MVTYLARLFPDLCGSLRACTEQPKETPVEHLWYEATPAGFWTLQDFVCSATTTWRSSSVLWHDGLFFTLAFHILRTLQAEARLRRGAGAEEGSLFRENELVVLVGCTLRRMLGPFQKLMDWLLDPGQRWTRARFDLGGAMPCHVQCRPPGDLTGPSALYAYVLRHPRYRGDRAATWEPHQLQSVGTQALDRENYIMMSRPMKSLTVVLHAAHGLETDEIARYRAIEADMQLKSTTLDLDENTWDGKWQRLIQPLLLEGHPQNIADDLWRQVAYFCRHHKEVILQSSRMGAEEGTVRDHMAMVLRPRAPDHPPDGCARHTGRPDQLTPLGLMTWPRPVVDVLRDFPAGLQPFMDELRWRLVDWVAVSVTGKAACQVAIPLLSPCWPYKELGDAKLQLRALAVLIFAVYRQHYGDQARAYRLMSVHHKSQVLEEEGHTWWSRSCNSDREALVLVGEADHALMTQAQQAGHRRPPKPKQPVLYLYVGGGAFGQPDCIWTFVIRTKDPDITAAVVTAARLLGATVAPEQVQVADKDTLGDSHSELLRRVDTMWAAMREGQVMDIIAGLQSAPKPCARPAAVPCTQQTNAASSSGLPPPPPGLTLSRPPGLASQAATCMGVRMPADEPDDEADWGGGATDDEAGADPGLSPDTEPSDSVTLIYA